MYPNEKYGTQFHSYLDSSPVLTAGWSWLRKINLSLTCLKIDYDFKKLNSDPGLPSLTGMRTDEKKSRRSVEERDIGKLKNNASFIRFYDVTVTPPHPSRLSLFALLDR